MAVHSSQKGGIYIEVSGDSTQFDKTMEKVRKAANVAAKDLTSVFKGALSDRSISNSTTNLTRSLQKAANASKALQDGLKGAQDQYKAVGKELGLTGKSLRAFASLQDEAARKKLSNTFVSSLKSIQRATGRTNEEMNILAKSLGGIGNEFSIAARQGNAFDGVLTRLTGALGAYASARSVSSFVGSGIEANASTQDATVGLAAVIASTQKIRDLQGVLLEGRDKFNAALALSGDIAKRVDAATRNTVATEIQLLQAVQATLGAAGGQGISVDGNIKFLSDLANTMDVLKISLDRLDKEALALLTGKNLGNSEVVRRIPGISAEDIKSWIQAGTVVKNLEKAFEQYAYAGEAAAKTYRGASRDLSASLLGISEAVTKDLTRSLAEAKSAISDTFYEMTADGFKLRTEIEPLVMVGKELADLLGDKALGAAKSFSSGLESLSGVISRNHLALGTLLTAAKNLAGGYAAVVAANKTAVPAIVAAGNAFKHFRLEVVTAQSKLDGFANVGKRVFTALGGWTTVAAAAAGAIWHLATVQSESEKIASRYPEAMQKARESLLGVQDGANKAAQELNSVGKAMETIRKERAEDSLRKLKAEIKLFNVGSKLEWFPSDEVRAAVEEIAQLQEEFRQNEISANLFNTAVSKIFNELKESGKATANFSAAIETLLKKGLAAKVLQEEIANIGKSAEESAKSVAAQISGMKISTASSALASKQKTALKELQNEIERLKRTEEDYAQYRFDQKIKEYRELNIAASKINPLLAQYEQLWKAAEKNKITEKNLQVVQEFEKQYLSVVVSSQEAQIASIRERAMVYQEAGANMVRVAEWVSEQELRYSRNATAGMVVALKDYVEEASNASKNANRVFTNAFTEMEDALVAFVKTGKLSFSSLVDSIISDLARLAIRQSITAPLAGALQTAAAGWFGSSSMGESFGSGLTQDMVLGSGWHSGGILSRDSATFTRPVSASVFANAPRFHTGGVAGLKSNEVAAILERNEGVFTAEQMSRLAPVSAVAAAAKGGQPQVYVTVHNNAPVEVQTQTSTDNFGNVRMDLIIEQVDQGLAGRMMNGTSRLGRAIDKTRGTNRASAAYRKG